MNVFSILCYSFAAYFNEEVICLAIIFTHRIIFEAILS